MSVTSGAPGNRRIGIALVLSSAVAFAVGPTAAKVALDNGANVLTVVAARGLIGAALPAAPPCDGASPVLRSRR